MMPRMATTVRTTRSSHCGCDCRRGGRRVETRFRSGSMGHSARTRARSNVCGSSRIVGGAAVPMRRTSKPTQLCARSRDGTEAPAGHVCLYVCVCQPQSSRPWPRARVHPEVALARTRVGWRQLRAPRLPRTPSPRWRQRSAPLLSPERSGAWWRQQRQFWPCRSLPPMVHAVVNRDIRFNSPRARVASSVAASLGGVCEGACVVSRGRVPGDVARGSAIDAGRQR